ncbi:MAG: molybdopterin-binding protein, partial [Alphaproteobacteria bacterium]
MTRDVTEFVRRAARQDQFLEVVDRDEAMRRFHAAVPWAPLGAEPVALGQALGRVLAADVVAPTDAPAFDRSVVDGFALRAADTAGASDETPRRLALDADVIAAGRVPDHAIGPGRAMVVATGGMVPRGADAVVMVEHTDLAETDSLAVDIRRPAAPGQGISFAGSDIGRGETVLRPGQRLGAREIGTLAAVGVATVEVVRRPIVAVLSTGDEIVAPGDALTPGQVYDANGAVLAAAVAEQGGIARPLGIAPDDEAKLEAALGRAGDADMILVSGGTSKGAGDLTYRVVARMGRPGVLVHGVALKPGKPLCLA